MKKISVFLICVFLLVFTSSGVEVTAVESEYILKVSKTGEMWDNYVNMMNIVFPGGTVSGLYYHKLYAKYDDQKGGFVVIDKVASHCSYTQKVEEACFGLCFSYNPEYSEGKEFGKENFAVWDKIRAGDVLYPHGIDFTQKSIKTEGSLMDGTLSTDAYFTVSFEREALEPTAYTDKTVVALGDSVTCNGGWTEAVGDLMGCEIINSGVSANRTTEALARFESDVASYHPNIVLLMFGINDCVQYYYSDKTVAVFKTELMELYNKCKNIGADVIFLSPNNIKIEKLNFDRYKDYGGLQECFPKFVETVKIVAAETGSHYIDIYSHFSNAEQLLCDTVHPNSKGYEIITSVVSQYLISYADIICGESIEGYISTYKGDFSISDECMYISPCKVKELKTYFCNEVQVLSDLSIVSDDENVKEGFTICWIDKYGERREYLKIKIDE